jgi:hypothetical protein
MGIKRISQEKYLMAGRNNFRATFSKKVALEKSGRKQVYRLASGSYVWRK